jgi:hypothetical protein
MAEGIEVTLVAKLTKYLVIMCLMPVSHEIVVFY